MTKVRLVNTNESLLQIKDFENTKISESSLNSLSQEEISTLFRRVKDALHDLKEEKITFMATTKVRKGSNIYETEIATFNLRHQKLVRNYMTIERKMLDNARIIRKKAKTEDEDAFMYLYVFWKNAKKLNLDFYNEVTLKTQETNALPNRLKRGN